MIAETITSTTARDAVTAALSVKVAKDCRLGKEAQAVQETMSRSTISVTQQHALQLVFIVFFSMHILI